MMCCPNHQRAKNARRRSCCRVPMSSVALLTPLNFRRRYPTTQIMAITIPMTMTYVVLDKPSVVVCSRNHSDTDCTVLTGCVANSFLRPQSRFTRTSRAVLRTSRSVFWSVLTTSARIGLFSILFAKHIRRQVATSDWRFPTFVLFAARFCLPNQTASFSCLGALGANQNRGSDPIVMSDFHRCDWISGRFRPLEIRHYSHTREGPGVLVLVKWDQTVWRQAMWRA